MRYFYLFLIFSSMAMGQETCNYSKEEIVSIFKHINKTDASNLKKPVIRNQDFHSNFDTIVYLMNCSNFEIQKEEYSKKELKNIEHGISRTLTHIFQSAPERILNDSIISLFKRQLEISNIERLILINALSVYRFDYKDDLERLKDNYLKALNEWNIKEEELHY